jgi:CYTH domain-containing protein
MNEMRNGEDEARTPKYAHIERERRWLVDRRLRPDLNGLPHILIEDRYIFGTRMRLRRMTDSAAGKQSLKLTKKYECADPLARPIVTAYLAEDEYVVLSELVANPLMKRRYKVDGYSIDCFEGALAGLELAEIEWPDDEGLRALDSPSWAIKDISDDMQYQGGTLATVGMMKDEIWRNF